MDFIHQHRHSVALALVLLVVVGSLQPVRPEPALLPHRSLHFLAFGGASLVLLLLVGGTRQRLSVLAAVAALGLVLEYLQHLIYRSPIEWWDVRDDFLADIAALVMVQIAEAGLIAFRR